MKKTIVSVYQNSLLYEIILWLTKSLTPKVKHAVMSSKTISLINWFEKNILNNKYLEIFFNTKKVGEAWYNSAFYQYTTFWIRRMAFHIPRLRVKFHAFYIGIFLLLVLLFPAALWENFYMVPAFFCVSVIFICQNSRQRTGIIYILINIIISLFIALMLISIPTAACKTLSYFLLAVDLFFLISFSIRNQRDLEHILMYLFLAIVVLCTIGIIQAASLQGHNNAITGVYGDPEIFAEILILLFPFAFVYPITLNSKPRRFLYSILIMAVSFWVITATQSRAAFIAYFVELVIIIILIDRRYIPMILFLAPTFSGRVINNIISMWTYESSDGNFFENIIRALRNFWVNGFGVSTDNFVNLYNSTALHYGEQQAFINVPNFHISAVYFNILVNIGAIVMLGFMYYILKIAHSSITCMFRATPRQKIIFVAGLAALLGISISSLFESSLFEPRVLIMYWAMLGLLRSGRIIRLGVLD